MRDIIGVSGNVQIMLVDAKTGKIKIDHVGKNHGMWSLMKGITGDVTGTRGSAMKYVTVHNVDSDATGYNDATYFTTTIWGTACIGTDLDTPSSTIPSGDVTYSPTSNPAWIKKYAYFNTASANGNVKALGLFDSPSTPITSASMTYEWCYAWYHLGSNWFVKTTSDVMYINWYIYINLHQSAATSFL